MMKRESTIAIISLVIVVIASQISAFYKVDIDAGNVTMVVVTAIAALVRGDGPRKEEKPDGEVRPG